MTRPQAPKSTSIGHVYTCPSIYMSTTLSIHLPIGPSICPSIDRSTYLVFVFALIAYSFSMTETLRFKPLLQQAHFLSPLILEVM